MTPQELWNRYCRYLCRVPEVDLALDIGRMHFDDAYFEEMAPRMGQAYDAMEALEKGAIANPDENRMVGHYWLRAPELAPNPEIAEAIRADVAQVKAFAAKVEGRYSDVLVIGIGGSALGPMLAADALGQPDGRRRMHFLDNTDPDGVERTLAGLHGRLNQTLAIVTSKSGTTPETYNGMVLAAAAWKKAGLSFASHAVAVTKRDSDLDKLAVSEGWIERFPMYDWVGGRTSELSAVGLLPAALQAIDIDAMLAGAAACDRATRSRQTMANPAALMALMWHKATGGRGERDMVVLPYKDRLLLFSRYLQQLVMESLGKERVVEGKKVHQGIAVYGNKGSTDQHAYVQQLREGVDNFFATFIRVLESGGGGEVVREGKTAGDFLHGFLMGTREALYANGRQSMTVTVKRVDARTLGALIALFERAVGFYATLVGINAYHQPGVEAGKKAAKGALDLQAAVEGALEDSPQTAEQIAERIAAPDRVEAVLWILEHLAANGRARQEGEGAPARLTFLRKPR